MEPYEMTLERILPEVSFGYGTIRVYRAPKLQALQTGYSDSPAGGPVGETVGGWRREWVVIGNEDCCGDPILIDSSAEGFPVYTAIHGEGAWKANQIAVSLEAFGRCLAAVARIATGRENPVALQNNPLPQSDRELTLATIQRENPGLESEFWEILLG